MKPLPLDYDDRVLALLSQGLTRKQIAEHMGTTKSAICGKIWRLQKSGYVRQRLPRPAVERKTMVITEMERRILVRLAVKDDLSGREIANADWPELEEMASWQAIRDLEKKGLIFRGVRHGDPMYFWAWRITGCARLLVAPVQTEQKVCTVDLSMAPGLSHFLLGTPNAETLAAFDEVRRGGGQLYSGPTEGFLEHILDEDDEQ